jgi:hypothetical protein
MLDMTTAEIEQAQDDFVGMMPDIESIAGYAFSDRDPEAREEAVAEAVAQCWQNHLHCVAEEKGPGAGSMAYYGVQNVKSGRSFAGSSATPSHFPSGPAVAVFASSCSFTVMVSPGSAQPQTGTSVSRCRTT